jgi:S1-C subfamily serine protease
MEVNTMSNGSPFELSQYLAALVESAAPSLVRGAAGRRPAAPGAVWAPGVVITVQHALPEDSELAVGLEGGRTAAATLAGRDPAIDLAVLHVDSQEMTPAAFGDLDALQVGHLALAVARPGRTVRAALGVVSAIGDSYRTNAGGRVERYLEAAVPLPAGFAGGLLLRVAGAPARATDRASAPALGLLTPAVVRGAAVALPLVTLTRVVTALLEHGRMERGFLGIGSYPGDLPAGLAGSLGQRQALVVVSIATGSPAERAGLLLGDVVVALDGRPVRHVRDLIELLDEERIGAEARLKIVRAGALNELPITIGARN